MYTREYMAEIQDKMKPQAGSYLVALGAQGLAGVTGAWLTALAAGQLPVVGGTLVTAGAQYMGQTQAAATLFITGHVRPGAQGTAFTACRGLC